MDSVLLELEKMLNELINNTFNGTGYLFGAAKLICGIGFLVFAYFEGYHQILGEKWDWKKLGAPTAIILGVFFYGTFLGITNSALGLISSAVKQELALDESRFYQKLEDFETDKEQTTSDKYDASLNDMSIETNQVEEEEEKGFISTILEKADKKVESAMLYATYSIFKTLAQIAIMVLLIIRSFFLITLSLFGIFAIALSIYPPLKGSFAAWLQKYINVYLWLPVSYIMEYILLKMISNRHMGDISIGERSSNSILMLISVAAIIGFAMVPVISSWFVNAATVSAASKMKGKASQAGKSAAKAGKKLVRKVATKGLG